MQQAWLLFNWLFYYLPAVDCNVEDNVTTANSLLFLKKSLTSGWSYCSFHNLDRESWVTPLFMFSPAFDSHPRLFWQTANSSFPNIFYLSVFFISYPVHASQISLNTHLVLVPTETLSSHGEMLLPPHQPLRCWVWSHWPELGIGKDFC